MSQPVPRSPLALLSGLGELHTTFVTAELVLAFLTVVGLLWVIAPYGRHERPGWGPTIPNRYGWMLMESPTLLAVVPLYFLGPYAKGPISLGLLGLWLTHYVYRTLVFPFQLKNPHRPMPLAIVGMAIGFNCLNALVISTTLSWTREYAVSWLADPRFLCGTAMFFLGTWINRSADAVLRKLRQPGTTTYAIPHGGLYELISCPNYFGEVLLWFGFAVASWSLGGLTFALYTCANLVPRAVSHHRWYRQQFPDYPAQRRAVLPFLF